MEESVPMSERITRRDFLKGVAVGTVAVAGTGLLAGCGSTAGSNLPEKWDKEADVVVVGYGGAGAAATIEATKAGASVIMLEKMPIDGGSTAICGGIALFGGGTALQKACGFEETRDDFYKYVFAAAGDGADPDIVGVFADKSVETYDWMVSLGCPFKPSFLPGKYIIPPTDDGLAFTGNEEQATYAAIVPPVPHGHHAQAAGSSAIAWWPPIQAAVKATGAEVIYEAPVTRLIADQGRVVGVVAEIEGTETFVKAKKAVLLCAGGFAENKEMLAQHAPAYLRCGATIGTKGDDGAGIKMGQAVGGDVRMMGQVLAYTGIYGIGSEPMVKGILVDGMAQRFIGEDNYGEWTADAIVLDHPTAYLVYDDAILKELAPEMQAATTPAAQANTIAELATAIGVDPAVLEATVATYNTFAAEGKDPIYQKNAKYVQTIGTAPFYALNYSAGMIGYLTTGGLRTNTKSQVLDTAGEPVPGLYSAGRNAFGVIARHYPGSGTSVADAFIFGRIAGQEMAAQEAWDK
jgi:3-oxo-5alpha-steroid 4-dehydrogenase